MHIVWKLPPQLPDAPQVQALALQAGVGVYALDGGAATDFDQPGYREKTLLLGYSSLTEDEIQAGIARLAQALR